jgi:hypothetical protein
MIIVEGMDAQENAMFYPQRKTNHQLNLPAK